MSKTNQQPSLSIAEFEKILKYNGIRIEDNFVASNIYNFFINRGMDFEDAKKFIIGVKRKNRLTADWITKDGEDIKVITYDDAKKKELAERELAFSKRYLSEAIRSHSSVADRILYERLAEIDAKFKEVYKERKQYKIPRLDITIRSLYEAVKRHGEMRNEELELMLDSEVEKLYNLASVYSVLVKHFKEESDSPDRAADYVMGKRLALLIEGSEEIVIDKAMERRVDQLLTTLENAEDNLPEEEKFSEKELQQLFKKVTSLVYSTDAAKAQGARLVLREYLNELQLRAEDPKAKKFLNETSAKKIILKAGTLLNQTAESLEEATMFMLGKTAQDVMKKRGVGQGERNQRRKDFSTNFPGFKIEGFTVEKQLYLLKNNPSSLININLLNIIQSNSEIVQLLADAYNIDEDKNEAEKVVALREMGFDPEKLIHADNVVDLLQRKRAGKKFEGRDSVVENIRFLTELIPTQDIQKIVKHNYSFLCQNPEWVKENITNIYNNNKDDAKKLKKQFEELVNSFYRFSDGKGMGEIEYDRDNSENASQKGDYKFKSEREYIELNIFALNTRKAKDVITKENYRERLYQELSELKQYLDSKQFNKKYEPQKTSIAYELYQCGIEEDVPQTKGAFKRKFKKLCEMAQFLIEDETTPVGFYESVSVLISSIDLRLAKLKLVVAEGETIADPIALDFKTRIEKSKESEKAYLEHIELLKTKLKSLKSSPRLKERMSEELAGYELQLEEINAERKHLSEERQWMIKLYEERMSWKNEMKFLDSLYLLFSTVGGAIKAKKDEQNKVDQNDSTVVFSDVELQIKMREIECLEAVIRDNKQHFEDTYRSDRDKLGSHAKKWSAKIRDAELKLERLRNELNSMLDGAKIK